MFTIILYAMMVYLLIGILFSIPFLARGISRVDEAAKDTSFWFKLIIFPATVLFWPTLLKKWVSYRSTP